MEHRKTYKYCIVLFQELIDLLIEERNSFSEEHDIKHVHSGSFVIRFPLIQLSVFFSPAYIHLIITLLDCNHCWSS